LIEALRPFIDGGKIKVYSIDSVNNDSWMNYGAHPLHKTYMHKQWNYYVYDEVIPFIKKRYKREQSDIFMWCIFWRVA
jgi:esterase/lipase superfamily enzyme